MKAGRVIDGDEHDAQTLAEKLVRDARVEADRIMVAAQAEASKLEGDVKSLAGSILADARAEADRIAARAAADAARLREDAKVLANQLVESMRGETSPSIALPPDQASGPEGDRSIAGPNEVRIGDSLARGSPSRGQVDEIVGLVVRATVPGVALGEVVKIDRRGTRVRDNAVPVAAEVVGFRGEQAVLLPLGDLAGIGPASQVWRTGDPLTIRCGDDLLGRVLDGIGEPIDGGAPLAGEPWAVDRAAPPALSRPPISAPQATGVRAIDTMLTLGRGQRIGLFAAAGVGKSTLLGQIARGTNADVIVACLVGERGRELGELLGDELAAARGRTVVVCATSDAPPLARLRAVHTATAIAEWYRERRGASVLLLVDSLTRVARAQREVGLSAGEPPARHGYPPSVFALLPRIVERAGATSQGAITAIYTVLVAGNDMDEPIADEVRGLVDGHLVLDRRLAQRGHFPPIDVVASVSRLMPRLVDADHAAAAGRVRERLAIYEEHRDLVTLGAYQAGRDPKVDDAIASYPAIERVLRQKRDESADWDRSLSLLLALSR